MKLNELCAAPGCTRTTWRVCERCYRPFCDRHATWHRKTLVVGVLYTFNYLCAECRSRAGAEDERAGAHDREGEGGM